jgi:hypothetical protein
MYEIVARYPEDEIERLLKAADNATWKNVVGENDNYRTSFYSDEIYGFSSYTRAFFLSIPESGMIHRHVDTPRPEATYHIPLITNNSCMNRMIGVGDYHLDVGYIYFVDRQVEHESINDGDSDRIHLIVESIGEYEN